MSVAVDSQLARKAVQTIKFLAADAVEQANSGHPGLPMGVADIAWVLWSRYLRYDPRSPDWPDRDRFVLSAGHGCALLYGMLHLAGYDLSLDDIKAFRQWDSKTPGHPEFGHTVGVEATTGPLGQGISNAVGMAIGARMLAARVDADSQDPLIGHRIFTICSDGDMMEGVSGEACSLAGHLGLGNLLALYDDNHISIEGSTDLAFSEDVCARYVAYGWDVQRIDGHDHDAIAAAIDKALACTDRPSLIACRTHIAHGAPNKQDSADAHGSPLGEEELKATKEAADWPVDPMFQVPEEVRNFFRERAEEGAALRTAWDHRFETWVNADESHGKIWSDCWQPTAPQGLTDRLIAAAPDGAGATRVHSSKVLQIAGAEMPGLVGGSADLSPSTKSTLNDSPAIARDSFAGRNFHFGVREHAMGSIVNGMLYHGAFRPYGATFLVFSDYMRPTLRLAALAKLPAIHIFTHDSIFVGEDGPTHQPIEHAWVLRMIPGLDVYRPADGVETALCWGLALESSEQPSVLLLTRQSLPPLERKATGALADMRRGAYLVAGDDRPDAVIAATGSEVHLAIAAREQLAKEGKKINVVSIPCYERFRAQGPVYAQRLFPGGVPVASIEAGITEPWQALTGATGLNIGIDQFGASAPGGVLGEKFGFTAESVTSRVRDWLG